MAHCENPTPAMPPPGGRAIEWLMSGAPAREWAEEYHYDAARYFAAHGIELAPGQLTVNRERGTVTVPADPATQRRIQKLLTGEEP